MNGIDRFFEGMNISATGLSAERIRMNVITQNLAGANLTKVAGGGPYVRRVVEFAPLVETLPDGRQEYRGVQAERIAKDTKSEHIKIYDPGHSHADSDGYVTLPNVNSLQEMADMVTAMRAYEANLQAQQGFVRMTTQALQLARG